MKELIYGHWYKCSECMPEDFEELIKNLSKYKGRVLHISHSVLVCGTTISNVRYNKVETRIEGTKDSYNWVDRESKYTHWMAIPKLDHKLVCSKR